MTENTAVAMRRDRLHARRPSVFVVLQGGGCKGAWQAGFLRQLLKAQVIDFIAAWGASAGTINGVLLNRVLAGESPETITDYWLSRNKTHLAKRLARRPHALPGTAINLARWGWESWRSGWRYLPKQRTRFRHAVAFDHFHDLITTGLLPSRGQKAAIYTYAYLAEVDGEAPVLPPESQDPVPLSWAPNREMCGVHLSDTIGEVDVALAAAASCALPFVETPKILGVRVCDGGVFSNLAADKILFNGTTNADIGMFVLTSPLTTLATDVDPVNFKSLWLLHRVKEILLEGERVYEEDSGSGPPTPPIGSLNPWFVAQPNALPEAGLVKGIFYPDLMEKAVEEGSEAAEEFIRAFRSRTNVGATGALHPWDLRAMTLPPLPTEQPKFEGSWVRQLNTSWSGAQLQYPRPEDYPAWRSVRIEDNNRRIREEMRRRRGY